MTNQNDLLRILHIASLHTLDSGVWLTTAAPDRGAQAVLPAQAVFRKEMEDINFFFPFPVSPVTCSTLIALTNSSHCNDSAFVVLRSLTTASPTSTTKMSDPDEHLPESLWLEVMLHLSSKDLVRLFCTHSMFAQLRAMFWGPACEERWIFWSPSTAASTNTQRRQQLESPDLWRSGLATVTNSQAIYKLQASVNSRHQMILAEWLIEVTS